MAQWNSGWNEAQSEFYNDPNQGQRAGYEKYLQSLGYTGNQLRYAMQQYDAVSNDYLAQSLGKIGTPGQSQLFTDWLSGGGGQGLLDGYNLLSYRSRGANPGKWQTGRAIF